MSIVPKSNSNGSRDDEGVGDCDAVPLRDIDCEAELSWVCVTVDVGDTL